MKAILVIDMPEACADGCPVMCRARGINHRPSWCPLKPLPNKLPIKNKHRQWQLGWNDCIDAITGETE